MTEHATERIVLVMAEDVVERAIDNAAFVTGWARDDVARAIDLVFRGVGYARTADIDPRAIIVEPRKEDVICRACYRAGDRRIGCTRPTGQRREFRRPAKRGGGTEPQYEYQCHRCTRTFWTLTPPPTEPPT